ncbi:antibiotic biosynthesis monooxygenase [Hymenobacter sp. 5516J-16]|uniref:antibiotic biosynthesis monooxygenase n=1 Tax=Hymenobacter sp. 5516J-16 TaxID=2932253 RepID=UPI0021D44447|nr:antibiotic biosynthesis monooxygenase [Hymenobacter sp. 5516J-16]
MITVQVSYRVVPGYAEQNQRNIAAFLTDFAQLDAAAFRYSVYTKDDGVTFVHLSVYRDEATQQQVLAVPSFRQFQQERDASGLDNTHTVEILRYVGSSAPVL